MPDPTMNQLIDQLANQSENANITQSYRDLVAALREYDSKTADFRQLKGRRKLPLVTSKEKEALMKLHKTIGDKSDDVLKNNPDNANLNNIVHKILALSVGNYNALRQYDPSKGAKTLASIEEDVRTLTIHHSSVALGENDALKGNVSERTPFSFYDENGKRVSGVFTKAQFLDPEKQCSDIFQEIKDEPYFSNQKDADTVNWLKDNLFNLLRESPGITAEAPQDASNNDLLAALVEKCVQTDMLNNYYIDANLLQGVLEHPLRQHGKKLDDNTYRLIADKMKPMIGPLSFSHEEARIPFNARIDTRNAAMSTVADLLGMPNVVARARPLRIIDANGNAVEGTFMEAGKGMDLDNLPEAAASIQEDCLQNTDGKGFKDIANLQILDYICGNYDRHPGNIFYQFNSKGKLCGAQGIDNDGCLGDLPAAGKDLKNTDLNYNRMINLGNLKVIPKDTYKRVLAMDPSMLKYALRGFGLSERELDCAAGRLTSMQKYFRSRKMKKNYTVMSDSAFKKANIEDLIKVDQEQFDNDRNLESIGNTFNLVNCQVPYISKEYQNQTKQYKDIAATVAVNMGNRAMRNVPGIERKKGSALQKLLSKRTWSAWTSQNYRDLQSAVDKYVAAYKDIEDRLNRANSDDYKRMAAYRGEKDAVVSRDDLLKMQRASIDMRDAAQKYLTGKGVTINDENLHQQVQYPAGASDYTKRRIDAAVDALRVAKQGDTIKDLETRTAEYNVEQAEADRARHNRERNPELYEDLGNIPVQNGPMIGSLS